MNNQAEFFDSYAHKWDSMERADICDITARVVRECELAEGMRVLDVGTGTGVMIPAILNATGNKCRISAIDISRGMLDVAKSKGFPQECVCFELADIHDYPAGNAEFDRVICHATLPHFDDKPLALANAFRLLKPGGCLAISFPMSREAINNIHSEAGGIVAKHRAPDEDEMSNLLKNAGFVGIRIYDEPDFYLAMGRKPAN